MRTKAMNLNLLQKNNIKRGKHMYENCIENIKKAQAGDKYELEKLIKDNNRTYLEYCKKI